MDRQDKNALDSCVKCSICVANCPVAQVTSKFAGPKQVGPDLERFRLEATAAAHPTVGYCTNCKNCDIVCPSGVKVSTMINRARVRLTVQQGAPWRDSLLAHAGLLGKVSRLSPGLMNWACDNKGLRRIGKKILGINSSIGFPHYAANSFYAWYAWHRGVQAQRKVVYYPGCYVTYNAPEIGAALVKVLEQNGTEVAIAKFGCCGLPLIANGLWNEAKGYAGRNIAELQRCLEQGYVIITSCPSCNLTLRNDYQELGLAGAAEVSEYIFDVFEYLQLLQQQGEMNTRFQAIPYEMSYHQPCHLKAQRCGIPSIRVLGLVPALKVRDLASGCCGQAGSYGFKQEKYEISMAIGQGLFSTVKQEQATGCKQVLTECGMCRLRIAHATGVEVIHPIQVLAEAYGENS